VHPVALAAGRAKYLDLLSEERMIRVENLRRTPDVGIVERAFWR
jgi:hypothetical protein